MVAKIGVDPAENELFQVEYVNSVRAEAFSGMRGAPPKASLAADFVGPTSSTRPQSAAAILSGGGDTGSTLKRPQRADPGRPIPEGPKKHIMTGSFAKQLTREQWASRPMRVG